MVNKVPSDTQQSISVPRAVQVQIIGHKQLTSRLHERQLDFRTT